MRIGPPVAAAARTGYRPPMRASGLFLLAGLLEIGGGYLVWLWLRESRALVVGLAGFLALALYGLVPVFQSQEHPFGRVYAAYGSVFIVLSVLWGWAVDGQRPDQRDWLGVAICLVGAAVTMWPRGLTSP
jgi:small multidrug resistance family-3 protein